MELLVLDGRHGVDLELDIIHIVNVRQIPDVASALVGWMHCYEFLHRKTECVIRHHEFGIMRLCIDLL